MLDHIVAGAYARVPSALNGLAAGISGSYEEGAWFADD
jgi:hypothetical protein